jgi:hypothetical protein
MQRPKEQRGEVRESMTRHNTTRHDEGNKGSTSKHPISPRATIPSLKYERMHDAILPAFRHLKKAILPVKRL